MTRDPVSIIDTSNLGRDPVAERARIDRIRTLLAAGATGAELVREADFNDLEIAFDRHMTAHGQWDPGLPGIRLSPRLDDSALVFVLAHELRHFQQSRALPVHRGGRLSLADNQRLALAEEADADAIAFLALDQAAAHKPELWTAWEDARIEPALTAFYRGPVGSVRAVFDAWPRLAARRASTEALMARELAGRDLPADRIGPADLAGLGRLPTGGRYLETADLAAWLKALDAPPAAGPAPARRPGPA